MLRKSSCILTIILMLTGAAFGQGGFKPRDANEETAWNIYTQYKQSKAKEAQLTGAIDGRKKDYEMLNVPGGILGIGKEDRAEMLRWQKERDAELALQRKLLPIWNKRFRGRYGELADINETIYDPTAKRTMDRIEFRLRNFPYDPKAARPADPETETGDAPGGRWTLSSTDLWSDNPQIEKVIQEYAVGSAKVRGTISDGSSVHSWVNPNRPGSPKTSLAVTWSSPPPTLRPGQEIVIRAHAVDQGSDSEAGEGDFVSFNVAVWATSDEKIWVQASGGGRDLYAFPGKEETKEYRFTLPTTNYRVVIVKVHTGNTRWSRYFQYIYEWH